VKNDISIDTSLREGALLRSVMLSAQCSYSERRHLAELLRQALKNKRTMPEVKCLSTMQTVNLCNSTAAHTEAIRYGIIF